jgi:hypothetical protein
MTKNLKIVLGLSLGAIFLILLILHFVPIKKDYSPAESSLPIKKYRLLFGGDEKYKKYEADTPARCTGAIGFPSNDLCYFHHELYVL